MEELNRKGKICSPYSTGGAGFTLENRVQALFVTLMLSEGYAPCLPCWPIVKIDLQGKKDGFATDDIIVYVRDNKTLEERKLLCQVKRDVKIQKGNKAFEETIQRAWKDFNNSEIFTKGKDEIALISEMLGNKDFVCLKSILHYAKHSSGWGDFFKKINLPGFVDKNAGKKVENISASIKVVNNGQEISKEELYSFLKHFNFIGVDLEQNGIIVALLHSHIGQFEVSSLSKSVWADICNEVADWNSASGSITKDDLLKRGFDKYFSQRICAGYPVQSLSKNINIDQYKNKHFIALLCLVGGWEENNGKDLDILDKLFNEARSEWDAKIKEILNKPGSILSLKEGIWDVSNREEILKASGRIIFNNDIETFVRIAIVVLKDYGLVVSVESDVVFQKEDKNSYSYKLRRGIAESLALLSNNSEIFENCRTGFIKEKIISCFY